MLSLLTLRLITLFLVLLGISASVGAQPSEGPYTVTVWSRVLFGQDGRPTEISIVDRQNYPEKFLENVQVRIARATIPPPTMDGAPTTLRSGVEMRFEVTPNKEGGTVRFTGVSMGPMPVKTYFASYPDDIARTGGWSGDATGVCQVGTNGRCTSVQVLALPGMPESVRRYMRASLEMWEFEPQQLGDRAITGEYSLRVMFKTPDDVPENFREDKFLRILRGR